MRANTAGTNLKAVDPLLALVALAAHITHAEHIVVDLKLLLHDTGGADPTPHHI